MLLEIKLSPAHCSSCAFLISKNILWNFPYKKRYYQIKEEKTCIVIWICLENMCSKITSWKLLYLKKFHTDLVVLFSNCTLVQEKFESKHIKLQIHIHFYKGNFYLQFLSWIFIRNDIHILIRMGCSHTKAHECYINFRNSFDKLELIHNWLWYRVTSNFTFLKLCKIYLFLPRVRNF